MGAADDGNNNKKREKKAITAHFRAADQGRR